MGVSCRVLAAVAACMAFSLGQADAGTLTIANFGGPGGLKEGDNDAKVQTFMQSKVSAWHPGGTVKVTGAVVDVSYNGDGHVVGPWDAKKKAYVSNTLNKMDGGPFLANASGYDRITMTFSFKIYSLSFDYEIFPDGTTPDGRIIKDPSKDPNWPDFKFNVDGKQVFDTLGVMPGTGVLAAYSHSPASGSGTEYAPQYIGSTGTLYFPGGVTKLEFIDWPPTIGVGNLSFSDTPEPSSFILLICGIFSLSAWAWWRKTAKLPKGAVA
jgi:hypothetical protein